MGKKRVFIIHGWDFNPDMHWYPWLKTELEKRGIFVKVPIMKDPAEPKIKDWVEYISKLVGDHYPDCYLVGHSIGCQAILRYLAGLDKGQTVAGTVLVAPWLHLKNLETEKEKEIAKPWLTHVNLDVAKKHVDRSVAIFSDNDKWVPLEDMGTFKSQLGPKVVIEHNKGHFMADDGVKELPSALNALLHLIK